MIKLKHRTVIIIAAFSLTLFSCGNKEDEPQPDPTESPDTDDNDNSGNYDGNLDEPEHMWHDVFIIGGQSEINVDAEGCDAKWDVTYADSGEPVLGRFFFEWKYNGRVSGNSFNDPVDVTTSYFLRNSWAEIRMVEVDSEMHQYGVTLKLEKNTSGYPRWIKLKVNQEAPDISPYDYRCGYITINQNG